jgi:hypothetical protein
MNVRTLPYNKLPPRIRAAMLKSAGELSEKYNAACKPSESVLKWVRFMRFGEVV